MAESLNININSIFEDGTKLEDCSCTLILSSRLVNSEIPTQSKIQIPTSKIPDKENVTILIKQGKDLIARSFISMATLRRKNQYNLVLEAVGNKAEADVQLSWDVQLDMDKNVSPDSLQASQSLENPFEQILMKSDKNLNPEEFGKQSLVDRKDLGLGDKANNEVFKNPHTFADLPVESQSLTIENSGHHQSPPKIRLDQLLHVLEEKLKEEAAQGLPNIGEVNQLYESLKVSIDELQKEVTLAATQHKEQLITELPETKSNERFHQSAPVYNPKDFVITNEQSSPQFSEHISSQIPKGFSQTDKGLLRVPETRERKYSTDSKGLDLDKLNASANSRRISKSYNETGRSVFDDVKIEKNEDYLLTMRNQLTSKNLTFINDAMTRDIILYMAQNKKKISAVRLRRSITIGDKEDVDIDKKEYFNTNCNAKFLHFFQSGSKVLYLFNLVQPFELVEEKARKIHMDIDFDISIHQKSVITPFGMIFMAAGQPNFNVSNQDIGSNSLHLYNYKAQTLVEKAPMNCKTRQEFGLCYMSKNLFAIGGIVNGHISAHCERYDIRANKWIKLAPMSRPLREASVCGFNNRYLFRIFGIDSGNNIDHSIERYDAVRDSWTVMNVTINPTIKEVYRPFCTQISQDCVFLFGGKNVYGFSPKSCKGWVLRVEDKRGSNNAELIESRNFIPGLAGNFNQNSLLAHAGDILFLRESY